MIMLEVRAECIEFPFDAKMGEALLLVQRKET